MSSPPANANLLLRFASSPSCCDARSYLSRKTTGCGIAGPGAACRGSAATVRSAAGPLEAADRAGRGSAVSRPPVRRAAKRLWIGDGQWSYTQIVVRAASIPSPLSKTLEKMYGGQTPVSGPTIAGLRPHIPPVASTVHALPHAVAPSTSPTIRARTASGSPAERESAG